MSSYSDDQISRRKFGVIGITTISALAVGGTLAAFRQSAIKSQTDFENLLKNTPPGGKIAYSVENEIKVLDASTLMDTTSPQRGYQVPRSISNLAWLNDEELVFVSKIADQNRLGTTDLKDNTYDYTVVSDGVFTLNLTTGQITTILDPYSSQTQEIFGEISAKDGIAEKERENALAKLWGMGNEHLRRDTTDLANFQISTLAVLDGNVLMSIGGDWYEINADKKLQKASIIPGSISNQVTDPSGKIKIINQDGVLTLTDGNAAGLALEVGAKTPAWSK